MAKKPIGVICLILLSIVFAPYQGNAQPSSLGRSQTLSEFWAWNQTIVAAEWISSKKRDKRKPGSTTFKIIRVLKGRVTDGQVGDRITLAHHVAAETAKTYLVSEETTNGKTRWGEIRRADKTTITYIKQAPAIEAAPPNRLAYFVRFLDSTDQRVARDAARELSIAGFKHISAMSSDDLQLLRESIERSSKSGEYRLLLHYLIVGYVLAKGEDGLAVVDESILKNKDAAFTTTYSVMQALRYIWSYLPSNISKDRLRQSMRLVLDRPEFADLVISDLARWRDWSVQDRIMQLYEAPETEGVFVVKRAIVRYMRASTNDLPMEKKDKPPRHVVKGREYLATLKKQDPKTYRKALLFDFQRKTDKKPKRSLNDITSRISGPVDPKASWLSSEVIYTYAIHTFAFSPDGKTLVSGSGDGTVRWWNTVTGRRIETIKGHSTWCFSIAFRPDGEHMVTSSGDQIIKIWDVDRRRPIATTTFTPSLLIQPVNNCSQPVTT